MNTEHFAEAWPEARVARLATVDEKGRPHPYLSFKLEPEAMSLLPKPRPRFEVFVYSPRFEGVHLRGGKVARGGIRWSDRRRIGRQPRPTAARFTPRSPTLPILRLIPIVVPGIARMRRSPRMRRWPGS